MSSPLTVNYPTSLDDLTSLGRLNNRAFTTLNGSINDTDLSATLTDSSVFPSDGVLTLTDDLTTPTQTEDIIFTANSSNIITISTRGAFGSTAQSWSSGAYVRQRYLAEHHEALRDAIIAIETKVGIGATALSSTYQPLDADLTAIAALSPSNDDIIQRKAGAWTNRTMAQLKADLSLNNVENTALSTWAGSTNITTLGTIVTGTWNGSVIGASYGGAGTVSGILKANGSGTVSAAAAGTDYLSATAPGSDKQVLFNSSNAYGAAAGFEYQSGASPNVSITAQSDSHTALKIAPFSGSYSEYPFQVTPHAGGDGVTLNFEPGQNILGQGNLLLIGSNTAITPTLLISGVAVDPADGTSRSRLMMNPSLDSDTFFLFDTNGIGFADTNFPNLSESIPFRASATGGLNLLNETGDIVLIAGGDAFTDERLRIKATGVLANGGSLDASAVFQINSTAQGFLPPRMTEAERDAIGTPAEGLIVHNLTTNAPNYYDGAIWSAFGGASAWGAITGTLSDQTDLQSALDAKQASDATLTALAAFNTNGLLTQTATDTFTGRTITGTSNKIDVTNGDGVSGNPALTISATYVGQSSITTLGTITTGTLGSGAVLAGVTMTLGSDADGDIYYRASNVLTRLAKGTALQQLRMNAGATAPEWFTATAAPSGADPTASVGLSAVNGSASTFMRSDGAPALDQGITPTWTGAHTHTNTIALTSTTAANNLITQGAAINIGTTSTDGIVLQNTTAAAAGAQQYSSRIRFVAQGWKTNTTAASQTCEWILEARPVQGAANPTVNLAILAQVNGGGFTAAVAPGQILAPGGASTSQSAPQYSAVNQTGAGLRIGAGNAGNSVALVANNTAYVAADANANQVMIRANAGLAWGSADSNSSRQVALFSPANDILQLRDRNASTVGGNLILGGSGSSLPTSATASLVLQSGTAPGSSPADQFSLYSADWNGAGTAAAHFRNEEGHIIKIARVATYTPTNVTTDRSYDANSTTLDEVADVLGSLIADLQTLGFLG